MRAAGLKAIATVVESSAILIRSKHPSDPALVEKITKRIRGVITAQRYLLCSYNVPSNKLEACLKITPGRRAPTVSNLEGEDWKAVSVMIDKKTASDVMDDLAAQGADDILISKILNSRTSS
jgi:ATP phosphoribosyltransferase